MPLSVKRGNSWYPFIGDLASICTARLLLVFYGGEKFVSKMLANSDDLAGEPYRIRTCDTLIKSQVLYQLS